MTRDMTKNGGRRAKLSPGRFYITDHALLRYVERIMGVDVGAAREAMGRQLLPETCDADVLGFLADYMGIDVETVRDRMVTDGVRMACGCGAGGIRVSGVRYAIADGRVVTVYADHLKGRGPRSVSDRRDLGRRPAPRLDMRRELVEAAE